MSVRRAVLVVFLGLVSALVPLAAGAASAQAAPARGQGNVSPRLVTLADGASVARSDAGENRSVGLPASGAGSLLHQPDGSFLANARLTSVDGATKAALTRAGARVTAESVPDHLVTVAIDPTDIENVAAVHGVEWLEEVLTPTIHRTDLAGVASALQGDGVGTSAACGSRVVSEGDTQLGAATARTTYGVDGAGIKIGVLSDSYNNVGGAATDVSNGELPGAGNPCGYTTPVVVQADMASGGTDEARGMAQAVHDLAPGATIMVATAFNGDVDFANQIRNLATAGAKVIVDDISYFNEPVYQDGIIAKAIADVTASGVTYFSSAANSNVIIGGNEVASYEAQTYRPTTCPGTAISSSYGDPDCHDWDPGAGADGGNVINVGVGGSLQFKLGYNEPQYGIITDLDLFLIDNATNSVLATSTSNNPTGTKQAYELLSYNNTSGVAKTYRLVVGRYQQTTGLGGTPRFKVIMQTGTGVTAVQWNTSSGGDVIGPTSYGHNMMRGAGSIAAIRYNSTTAPETFSSRGPATYCWNPVVGTTAATALPSCVTDTIDVAATDGAANSFFGQLSAGVWRFYGTSQAAPHAAAIAVLQLAARPCRTPAEILAAQRSSGIAVGAYGVDAVGGGRVNASAAISGLASCSATPGAPTGVSASPGNTQATVSWTAPGVIGSSAISGYQVTPYIGATAQTAQTFNSTATTQTATGLTNGTAYTFKVAAINASGAGTDSASSAAVTPRTVPGAPTGVSGTPGNTTVDLSWTAPASNGAAITGYTVTPFIGATAQTPVVFNSAATSQTITGLTNGTAYTFKVKATNAAGTGTDSAASAAVTPAAPVTAPGAPTGVSGTPGNTTVDLTWTAPASNGGSAITGYTVTPYIGATAQTAVPFVSTATAQTITGLTNGTAYTFKVAATNASGTGTDSAASSAITPRTVPGAPTGVTGTPGNTTVDLSWTAPASGGSAITGYTVTPSIGATAQTPVVFASTSTSQTITGLTNGTAYTFKVKATNAAGSGADSTASSAITPRTVPGAPTGVSGTPGNTTVDLTWTAPASGGSAITGYTVTPFIGATAQTPVVFASTAVSQTITGLTNGTAYTFKVKATNAAGTGTDSAASAAITPRTVPGAPTAVSGTPGDTSVSLSWTAPASNGGSAITGYTVTPYIGIVAQSDRVFSSAATTQSITGLTNGTSYTFKVRATNAAGTGVDSGASLAVTPRSLPGAPTGVSGTPGNTTVDLSWTAPASDGGSAITGYTVTPFIGATAQTPVVFASTAVSQTITGLTNGTAYTFKVAATTAAGTGADSTASSAITPRTVPGAPTAVSGTAGNTQVDLTWTAPASNGGSAITGYTVTPFIGATAQTPVVFNSTATSQAITGLTNGTAYTFKVKATNAAGTGADSAASAAVTPKSLPGAPTGVTGTPGNTTVDLSWTTPASNGGSAITGYTVTPFIGATAQTPVVFASTATSQTITGLTNGTTYTFTVAATTSVGTGTSSTASSAITPRTVPGAPTGVTGVVGNTTVDLSWTAPASNGGSAITGYTVTPFIGATAQTPVVFASTLTAQTITGLTNGTAYTFKVKATNAAGTGTDSAASSAITPRSLPNAPTNVTGTPGNAQVALSWTTPTSDGGSAITGYSVTPFIGATAQTPVVFNSTATSQNITGLTNGTAYTFKVAAITAAGTGADSAASPTITPRTVPGVPTAVSGTPGDTQVDLSWTAPASNGGSAITGYTVTPYIGATAQTPVVFNSTATSQAITGLTNGTAYTFKVKATNAAGSGTDSTASAAVTPKSLPGAPTGVTGTPGNGQVDLSWTAPASNGGSAITGYTVTPYIGATAQTPVVFASTATSQTVIGLTNGTAYTFKVAATTAAGTGSSSAASSAITPRTVPGAPTNVTGTTGDAQVDLSWTAPASDGGSAITGYTVTPYIGATAQTPVVFNTTATSQTITGLTNGTAYTFKVKATNAAGTGTDSTASAAITPRTVPGVPTAVSGTAGNAQVALSWTAPSSNGGSSITGYTVTPFIGATAQTPVVFNTTATSQTITGLTNGTAYTFTVKATNAAGTGAASAASAAVTPVAPTDPWKPFSSWGAMVDRFYLDMLGRPPTSSERSSRVAQLTAGTLTPGGLVAALRFDTDNVNNVDPVTRLYRAYLLRIPDRGGLTYWIRQRRVNGKKLNAISDSFASSSEFKTKYGKLSNRAFVNLVYQNVLGRPGETSGVNYWTSRLDRKVNTRGQVMTGFSESNEYKTKQVSEVDVSVIYILLAGRAPSTSEFNTLVAALDAHTTTPTTIAQVIIDSPEYATKIGG